MRERLWATALAAPLPAGMARDEVTGKREDKEMRKFMRTTVLALVLAATPAAAQEAVLDVSNLAQARLQVQQLVQQLRMMQQQYQQLVQTYQAIAHLPQTALRELGREFNVDQFRNALPAQSGTLSSVMNGSGLGTGPFASSLQDFLGQNRVYVPTGQDFQADTLRRTATSVAGAQAMASQLYQSAANRIEALRGLETRLADAGDAKDVADLQARIAAEQAFIEAQQVQAQSLALWQAAQSRNEEQRLQEERRRQIDALIEEVKAHGG